MPELKNGENLIIIGGGPAGTSCAIHAMKLAAKNNKDISVTLIEPKTFGIHYNQCVGVISPHVQQLLKDINVEFPSHLIQREIQGYYLDINGEEIFLSSEKHNDVAFALRRNEFDAFMTDQAVRAGVNVIQGEAVTFDYSQHDPKNKFTVYCTTATYKSNFIIGAFGVGNGIAREFYKTFRYRPPRVLQSIITKIHPHDSLYINQVFGDSIRAFLPVYRAIEFGAMTPKGNHITVNVAGEKVSFRDMEYFLGLDEVRRWVPPHKELTFFKGQFPTGPADLFYGDDYLIIGDAAGLVRPFKGKGITSAILSGKVAAEAVLYHGTTRRALERNFARNPEIHKILNDYKYGIAMRKLIIMASNHNLLKHVISCARGNQFFETALYDAVSANRSYKDIFVSFVKGLT